MSRSGPRPGRRLLARGLLVLAALAGLAGPAGAAAEGEPRIHRVRPGETLSHVALYNFGDPAFWPAIYAANRDQIKDPSVIYPGQQLAIPKLDADRRARLRRENHAQNGN